MNIPLLNRNFELPTDGWYHLAPVGEFPNVLSDGEQKKKVLQVVDAEALQSMVNRFRDEAAKLNFSGIRIDFDHFSYDPDKSSEAAGWIMDLQNRADGLWFKPRWSDSGEAAVKGGRYRFVSPVWNPSDCQRLGNGRLRPLRLDSAGLTNDPNLKGLAPLSNRRNDAATNPTQTQGTMNPKLLEALGLAAEATEEATLAAIAELKNRVSKADYDELKNRHDALLASQVDADLDAFKDVITDRESFKTQLLANREGTLKLLRGIRKPEAAKPLHNRNSAVPPNPIGKKPQAQMLAQQQRAAVEEFRIKNRCTHDQAWQAVKASQPDLFKPETKEEE